MSVSSQPVPSLGEDEFRHEPLDPALGYLRVFRVSCMATCPACISLELKVVISGPHHAYTAVSYLWGDSSPTHLILVDGKQFKVRANLWRFLRHVAGRCDRDYWVDAICINQNDISERNEQVIRMGEIYSWATKVLLWLGSDSVTVQFFDLFYDV